MLSFEEALATLERIRRRLGEPSSRVPEGIRARVDFALAVVLQDWGDLERGRALLASSVPVLRSQAEDPMTHQLAANWLGLSAMDRGAHEEADRHLRAALELNQVAWVNCPCIVFRYSQLARNLSMQGRFDEAEAVLDSTPTVGPMRGQTKEDPMAYAAVAPLARARVKLDRGDPAAALALLPPDRADAEDFYFEHRRLLRGAALCALGRAREGLPLMESYAEKSAEESSAYHPRVAHWRAVTGLCALDAGNRQRAMELAGLARQAFTQQPGVSPYYKAPLATLDQKLRR
jgi:tetratricopeptide (TPR) repeat protein